MNEKYFAVVIKIHHKLDATTEIPTTFSREKWSKRQALIHIKENSLVVRANSLDMVYELYIDENPQPLTNESHTWQDA